MDKKLLLAVSLSMMVYVVWFGFVEKKYAGPAAQIPGAGKTTPKAGGSAAVMAAPEAAASAAKPEDIPVDRDVLETQSAHFASRYSQILIHPRGAAIVSCLYKGPLGDVELIENPNPGFFATWPDLTFKRDPSAAPGSLAFTATRPDGMRIRKEFLPEEESALPRIRITLSNPTGQPLPGGDWNLSMGPGLGTVASEKAENHKVWRAIGLTLAGGGSRGKVETLKPSAQLEAYRWVAVDNRYFLAAAIASPKEFQAVASSLPPLVSLTAVNASVAPRSQQVWEIPYYLGAKGNTWLTRFNQGLERSIDFGFFSQLGRLVLQFLNYLHGLTNNWGWAIILLTVALQILLTPLTYKSLKAAAAMKVLQPEIAKLQQKYSKDPTRLNAEMMDLYKKTGANPMGGCLPMLLQMPIFIALFNTLRNAWELHGAPWIFWVKDLSAKDPYYVLPLVMGALMFVQNKMNPPTTDPAQAKLMTWMPVVFTFMFLNFPAGLVLYWLTNSVMSALQQLALKDHFKKPA